MVDSIACLQNGRVTLVEDGREPIELESPYAEQISARERATAGKNASQTQRQKRLPARVVGVTRGRLSGELCYAINAGVVSGIFAQKPGTRDERRLFHNADVQLGEIDFSFAEEAFTCTVEGKDGTSSIGILADDGKGVRTVTEGDVLDRGPRWAPGGVGEIVYASAGIGRTQSGTWAGLAPFSLHRLRLNDGTVEVLVADAEYDYLAPVPISDSLIYAIRRAYRDSKPKSSILGALAEALTRGNARQKAADADRMHVWGNPINVSETAQSAGHGPGHLARGYELVRITPKSTEVVTQGAIAFDVTATGDIVYSSGKALYWMAPAKGSPPEKVANLERVEQIVICGAGSTHR